MVYGQRYRWFVVSHTDCFWLVLPTLFGEKYRWFMVSFTDGLWSVLPMVYGQSQLRISCKTRENWCARRGCPVCLFVCLINTVYVVYREDDKKWRMRKFRI